MGILFNSIKTFDDLFVSVLQQIYYAEAQDRRAARGYDWQGNRT